MSLTTVACRAALWIVLALTAATYAPGLTGGYLFDDYPNIVDNPRLHIGDANLTTLRDAAFATDTSLLKRPLASLSFALNYLATGLDPLPMKVVNLGIHLANVVLVYLILLRLWRLAGGEGSQARTAAIFVAAGWALAPINLTAVLYVVQRMESLSHLFVLGGLLAYLEGREHQLTGRGGWGFVLAGLAGGTVLGLSSKESAALLPLYATAMEWAVLRFRAVNTKDHRRLCQLHGAIIIGFGVGCVLLLPRYLTPSMWADRAFTLPQRLLTELRVLWTYVDWTLRPRLDRLGFYYDDYAISIGWLHPWTTALAAAAWVSVVTVAIAIRERLPLAALGIAWFLLAHTLTATVFPLELVFEHRNYFASMGLLLVPASVFALLAQRDDLRRVAAIAAVAWVAWFGFTTSLRASEWGHPLRLAQNLAAKQPQSARTQYELGRTYLVLSNYDPASPFTELATRTLERASALPDASPLADQALLMQSQHLGRADDQRWWAALQEKLHRRKPGPQEIAAVYSLGRCVLDGSCHFAPEHMVESYLAGLSHDPPSLELMASYANFALNALGDSDLALQLVRECVQRSPRNAQYRRNLIVVLARTGRSDEAKREFAALESIEGSATAHAWAAASLPEIVKIP